MMGEGSSIKLPHDKLWDKMPRLGGSVLVRTCSWWLQDMLVTLEHT